MVMLDQVPAGSRVERRKQKTRMALMKVSLELFYEKGIYWTKIEDITERADIGKGTFYQYFETKEDLLRAVLEEGLEVLLLQTEEVLQSGKPGPHAWGRLIEARLDFYAAHPEYLLLFHQVRGLLQLKTEPAKELREVYDRYFDRLGKLLKPVLNGKGESAVVARQLALALSAFTSGLLTHQLLFGKEGDFRRRRDAIVTQLEHALKGIM